MVENEGKSGGGPERKQAHSYSRAGYKHNATQIPSQLTHQEQPEAVGSHGAPEPWCLPTTETGPPSPRSTQGLPVQGGAGTASHLLQSWREKDTGSPPDPVVYLREGLPPTFVSHEGYTQPCQRGTSSRTQKITAAEWGPAVLTTA